MPSDNNNKPCLVCGNIAVSRVLNIEDMPVHCHLLLPSKDKALDVNKGEIDLSYCSECGHVFNQAFEPEKMAYTGKYENSLHFSPHFQEYAKLSAERLVERYGLYGKKIVEIGSGKGDFLEMLCNLGHNRGMGFDPSYGKMQFEEETEPVSLIRDFYSEKYANYQSDFIVCRHVLEHIEEPVDFVSMVRRVIENNHKTVVFFEVPNAMYTLRELGIWDIIYEHCSYFTPGSLEEVFTRSGFKTLNIEETFGGQFLTIEASPDNHLPENPAKIKKDLSKTTFYIEGFHEEYLQKVAQWERCLAEMRQTGKRVIAWGAGSKGVTFLNIVKNSKFTNYIVDINPRKTGMFVAGAGQQICLPEYLQDYQPDVVLVMNPNYVEEIKAQLADMSIEPKILLV